MLRQISLAWSNIEKNGRTIGLSSLNNWDGMNFRSNKNKLSTLSFRTAEYGSFQRDLGCARTNIECASVQFGQVCT